MKTFNQLFSTGLASTSTLSTCCISILIIKLIHPTFETDWFQPQFNMLAAKETKRNMINSFLGHLNLWNKSGVFHRRQAKKPVKSGKKFFRCWTFPLILDTPLAHLYVTSNNCCQNEQNHRCDKISSFTASSSISPKIDIKYQRN